MKRALPFSKIAPRGGDCPGGFPVFLFRWGRGLKNQFYFLTGFISLVLTAVQGQALRSPQQSLDAYHASLDSLRRAYPDVPALPDPDYFLFGMGNRRKILYDHGILKDVRTGEILQRWKPLQEYILPADYIVLVQTERGRWITIRETGTGIQLDDGKGKAFLARGTVYLPTFRGRAYAPVLRVLHHQALLALEDGTFIPDFYRTTPLPSGSAASLSRVLRATSNGSLLLDSSPTATPPAPASPLSAADLFLRLLER